MTDILDRLLQHHSIPPMEHAPLMDRAAEEIMRLRSLTFEMLAALSWLRGNGVIDDPTRFEKIEEEAKQALKINTAVVDAVPEAIPQVIELMIVPQPPADHALPTYKICPHCGDRNAKTVHLRKRPPMLQCNACGVEYKWPHRWM